ncbi:MAG: capsid cement protein [Thermodesulfobacteriota bacterium]|nr:capsid cement protein [Thermodesulfobacteriota bacterium]
MSRVEGPKRTFTAGEDLEAKRLFKIESGTTADPPEIVYCDAGETPDGITEVPADEGDLIVGRLLNAEGTFDIECAIGSAIARGDDLYPADDGKVSEVAVGTALFKSMQAPTADGEVIECLKKP